MSSEHAVSATVEDGKQGHGANGQAKPRSAVTKSPKDTRESTTLQNADSPCVGLSEWLPDRPPRHRLHPQQAQP